MKHLLTITAVIAGLVGTAFAGPSPSFKKTVVEPRSEEYGLGWYGALEAGVNAYQDGKNLNLNPTPFTGPVKSEVGGFGGGKVGYVFNTGKIRPALEGEMYYNGFGYTGQLNNAAGNPVAALGGSVNSFAYMANAIVRFDLGRFQPYVGAGIGGYWASLNVDSISLAIPGLSTNRDNASWAWQIIAGADYYFTERVSIFGEYKYLTYMSFTEFGGFGAAGIGPTKTDLDQHLFGIGVRLHF